MKSRLPLGPANSRLFVRLLTSYLCILFIPLIITMLILNVRQADSLRKDANTRAQAALEFTKNLLETWTDTAVNLSLTILLNQQTETLGYPLDRTESALRSIKYMDMLNSYASANKIVDSVWVYDTDNDVVYSSEKTRFEADNFHYADLDAVTAGVTAAGWQNVYGAKLPNMTGGTNQTVYYLSYVYPLRKNIEGFSGYILVNVDALSLYAQLNQVSALKNLVILNTQGVVQSAAQADAIGKPYADPSGLLAADAFLGTGESSAFIDQHEVAVAGALYPEPFIVAGVLQSNLYSEAIRITYLYAGLLFAIFLLVGVPLCYFVSKRMYHPLSQLIRDFERHTLNHPSQYKDVVRQTLNQLIDRNIRQESQPEQDPEVIFNNLSSFISQYLGEPLEQGLAELPYYAVVLAQLDEPGLNAAQSEKALPFFEQILFALAQKIVRPTHRIHSIAVRSGTVALMLPFADPADYRRADTHLQNLRSAFATFTKCTISFSLSTLKAGDEEFRHGLAEAETALRWKLLRGLASTIYYDDDMVRLRPFVYPRVQVNQIFITLELSGREELQNQFQRFISELGHADADVDDILLVFYQIIGQMIQYVARQQIPRRRIFDERESSPYRYMNQLETIDHIAEWVLRKLLRIHAQRVDAKPGGSLYINHFQSYVQAHCMEKLEPEAVAAALGISYSYLRRLLNVEMGTSFTAYLAEMRVQNAKEMLVHTDLSQWEIAGRVGFGSEQTFHRVFKSLEGLAPGEFRKQMQGKQ